MSSHTPKHTRRKTTGKPVKPERPYEDYPLFPHAGGVWAKKIRGRFHYFGPWSDPEGALRKYLEERDDLQAGRTPRARRQRDELILSDLTDHFLNGKENRVNSGELAQRSFDLLYKTAILLNKTFGQWRLVDDLAAEDFEQLRAQLAERLGPVGLANEIQRIKSIFKYGYEAGLIDKPVRFGPGFVKPSARVIRQSRQGRGLRMFERDELVKLLAQAKGNIRAMVLLGINAGLGNTDLALLPISAVDLDKAVIDYPRPKTAVDRVVPLWPETVEAIRNALNSRPEPKDKADGGLLFIGPRGVSYEGKHRGGRVAATMKQLLADSGVARRGLSFYALRRTFETVAEEALDLPAVQSIMGHAPAMTDMSATYRERVDMKRKQRVTLHVHKWLFGQKKKAK